MSFLRLALALLVGCRAAAPPPIDDPVRDVPGWPGRGYLVHLPRGYDRRVPHPVALALHGGFGNAAGMRRLTCAQGIVGQAGCLDDVADQTGFIIIYPNGSPIAGDDRRGFNAGGGANGYACTQKVPCRAGVDDIAYITAVLDDAERWLAIDHRREFVLGISNGGAMAHRLACQLANRIAGIASVAGENQYAAVADCAPARPIPILDIHGTEDPIWSYRGGDGHLDDKGLVVSAPDTVAAWVHRNGCAGTPETRRLADADSGDGTQTIATHYTGCTAPVAAYVVSGGGHTWPGGWAYLPARVVGKVARDWNTSEVALAFFLGKL